jgi:hypothetical protein
MYLHEVAPDQFFTANTPAELDALMTTMTQELGRSCVHYVDSPMVAAGATVTIAVQGGGTVGTFTADGQGQVTIPNLVPGSYILTAQHLGVVAPQDPLAIPRDYTRMIVNNGSSVPVSTVTLTMPDADESFPTITLVINNELNIQCFMEGDGNPVSTDSPTPILPPVDPLPEVPTTYPLPDSGHGYPSTAVPFPTSVSPPIEEPLPTFPSRVDFPTTTIEGGKQLESNAPGRH